ncbi:MAG: delta-60 repeat domain-containing protein [Gammaproteobacteria bacterium]
MMRSVMCCVIGIFALGGPVFAFNCGGSGNSGKPGQSGSAEGCARAGCHTPAGILSSISLLNKPTTAFSGMLYQMNVVVRETGMRAQNGGFNLAADDGVFGPFDTTARISSTTVPTPPCNRLDATDGELTHTFVKTTVFDDHFNDESASWRVLWRAPRSALADYNLKLYARGLTGDGNSDVPNDSTSCVAGTCSSGLNVTITPHPLLDGGFDTDGMKTVNFNNGANYDFGAGVAIQSDGKIVVAGSINLAGNNYDFGVARLNSDGSPDAAGFNGGVTTIGFNLGNNNADFARAVAIQADKKILVAGTAERTAEDIDFAVIRLLPNGNPDGGFGNGGKVTVNVNLGPGAPYDDLSAMVVQADGKILLAGSAYHELTIASSDFAVVRLNANGSPDNGFGNSGRAVVAFDVGNQGRDYLHAMALQKDGKIVLGGTVNVGTGDLDSDRFAVARLNANGTPDASFGTGGKAVVPVFGADLRSVAVQADGKIVLAGAFRSGGDSRFGIARLNSNGVLDSSFASGGALAVEFSPTDIKWDNAQAVAVQTNGKIVVAGGAYQFYPFFDVGVARLNADGSPDEDFGPGGKTTFTFGEAGDLDSISGIAIQADGKIVVAGSTLLSPAAAPFNSEVAVARLKSPGPAGPFLFTDSFEN